MMIILFLLAVLAMILGMCMMLGDGDHEASGMTVTVISIIAMIVIAVMMTEDEKNACEGVGGDYMVVDTEYNVALKQIVDIYGCVK